MRSLQKKSHSSFYLGGMNGLTGTKTVLAGSDWPLGPGQIQMSPARSPGGQAQATSRGGNQNIKNKVKKTLL